MSLLSTSYVSPNNLPRINLTIKNTKLLALDWFDTKTNALLSKLGEQTVFVPSEALDEADANQSLAKQVINQLDEYFSGERQVFDIPMDLSTSTPFQIKVWQTLLQIPYGQTISYATLAKNINKPTAFRACANANGKNPISLIVPCHRVIASDGSLGGYTGGLDIKQILLKQEGCDMV